MSPVSTVEDFEVEHKGSDSKLGKVEAEESYEINDELPTNRHTVVVG